MTPLVYEKFAGGWPAAAIIAAIALAVILWSLDETARERRRRRAYGRYVERVVTAAEVAGIIPPDPESLDATKPDDYYECTSCDATGMVEIQYGPMAPAWINCPRCDGTGERVA